MGPSEHFLVWRLRRGDREAHAFPVDALVLSLIVTLFVIDSLVNGMINPIYVLVTGALVSYCSGNEQVDTSVAMRDGKAADSPGDRLEIDG